MYMIMYILKITGGIKIGPGKSSRSHTADEFIFVKEIEEAIALYLDLLDGATI